MHLRQAVEHQVVVDVLVADRRLHRIEGGQRGADRDAQHRRRRPRRTQCGQRQCAGENGAPRNGHGASPVFPLGRVHAAAVCGVSEVMPRSAALQRGVPLHCMAHLVAWSIGYG